MELGETKCDSYHLSILGVFVGVGRTSDVIPHLTRCHRKNYTLTQSEGERETDTEGQRQTGENADERLV